MNDEGSHCWDDVKLVYDMSRLSPGKAEALVFEGRKIRVQMPSSPITSWDMGRVHNLAKQVFTR